MKIHLYSINSPHCPKCPSSTISSIVTHSDLETTTLAFPIKEKKVKRCYFLNKMKEMTLGSLGFNDTICCSRLSFLSRHFRKMDLFSSVFPKRLYTPSKYLQFYNCFSKLKKVVPPLFL